MLPRITSAAALFLLAATRTATAQTDWPSYNRTLTSERFSPLTSIDTRTVHDLHVVCSYDTGQKTAFQSGLVQVDNALFATTEHDTISLNPDTCKENWRVHENFPDSFLGAQRGVAVAAGRVFRGAANGRVYAYDEKSGKALWQTEIANQALGETVPAAPIAWGGLVFIGNAGGDNRGVKGRMYALAQSTGKIVWEAFLVPRTRTDKLRGPQAAGGPRVSSWLVPPGSEITGGASWTSYSLDPVTGTLYVPSGNPAPDFDRALRQGHNEFSGSIVLLDARTGAYRRNLELSPRDFHDWDASSAPAIVTSRAGRHLLLTTPKDGNLYAFDLASDRRVYKVPVTTHTNVDTPLTSDGVRFCPGSQGGAEWNGPAYDPVDDSVITGQVDWCTTIHIDAKAKVLSVSAAQPWTGSSRDGFGKQDDPAHWAGWLTAADATTGRKLWQFKSPNPILGAVTPTAGKIVFFGDMGGNMYALKSSSGRSLWSHLFDGAVSGGLITYDSGAGQKVAVSTGMTSHIWPTAKVTAKIYILGLR